MTDTESKNIKISYEQEILSVSLLGEIDHHSACYVRTHIDDSLFYYKPKTLVMDIGSVDFMDSSGLGLIMGRYTKAKEIDTELIIKNPSARAHKMLTLCGLDKLIHIEDDKEREDNKNEKNIAQ